MTAISPVDLSFVSDALLALVGQDSEAPYRTEIQEAARALQIERSRTGGDFTLEWIARKTGGPTFASECAEVIQRCRLTARQREVFDLRMAGLTFEEIGAGTRTTKQAVMNAFVLAMAKIGPAIRVYPYLGLGECIEEDTARKGKRRK